jgi:hypothetical protein
LSADLIESKTQQVARPLHMLVPLIKKDIEDGREASERAGMPYYRAAGEKLAEAKPQFSSASDFYSWANRHFGVRETQVKTYLSLAKDTGKSVAPTPITSLNDFKRGHLGHNRPTGGYVRRDWQPDVDAAAARAKADAERIRDAELTRQQERAAEQTLALRLIEIGYKVLAKELHPDKGGSRDAMARLNRVRDRLKQHA